MGKLQDSRAPRTNVLNTVVNDASTALCSLGAVGKNRFKPLKFSSNSELWFKIMKQKMQWQISTITNFYTGKIKFETIGVILQFTVTL